MLSLEENELERLRQCAVTRIRRPVNELIRFVRAPDGEIVPDLKRKLPGRGIWITAASDILEEAVKKNVFSRGLRMTVNVDQRLRDKVGSLLTADALQLLSLANKAGDAVSGFTKVKIALENHGVAVLIHASDAAEDGIRKLGQALQNVNNYRNHPIRTVETFNSGELSLALGRSNVVHAALKCSGVSLNFMAAVEILEKYHAGSVAYSVA